MSATQFVTVSNQQELRTALNTRTADTVIVLKQGNYGELTFNARESALPIKLMAADASKPPVFQGLNIMNANGVQIEGVQFTPREGAKWASGLTLRNCEDVVLKNNDFIGAKGAMEAQQRGVQMLNCTDVVVQDNDFSGLMRGAVVSESSGLKLTGNDLTNMRAEGFNFAGVKDVEIAHNRMSDFHPVAGDHPDFIQFWTRGTKTVSENIHIHNNQLIQTNPAGGVQGIFMDNDERVPYRNVVIEDNLIQSSAPHGIHLLQADGAVVRNNVALGVEGAKAKVAISVIESSNIVVTGNTANMIGTDRSVSVTEADNAFVSTQVCGLRPLTDADVAHLRAEAPFIRGTSGADRLIGTNRDDVILGGAGNDTISGNRGNDILHAGAGNDDMGGGAGSDSFVFSGGDMRGHQVKRIGDFSFADGDRLVFSDFAAKMFKPGLSANAGVDVRPMVYEIDSAQDLAEFGRLDSVVMSRRGRTDTLIIQVREADGDVLEIQLSNTFAQFVQAGGQLG